MKLRKAFHRLRTKILLFGLLMSIVPFLILGTLNIQVSKAKLYEEVDKTNQALIENAAYQLETLISHTVETMYVLQSALSYDRLNDGDTYYLLSSFMKNVPYAENVAILHQNGMERVKVDRWTIVTKQDLGVIQNKRLLEQIRTGNPYIGPVVTNGSGKITVNVAIPNRGRSGSDEGIYTRINLKQLLDQLITKTRMSEGSYLYVTDQQSFHDFTPGEAQPAKRIYPMNNGERVLAYALGVPGSEWLVVLAKPVDQAFASFNRLQLNLVLSTLLIALFVSTISVIFTLLFSRPIEKIERGVRSVADGNLSSRISVSTNDEIGSLALSFNEMAQKLQMQTNELLEEKKRLDIVVSGMGMGLVLIDESFRVRWMNRTITEWFGDSGDLMGSVCSEAFGKACRLCSHCPVQTQSMIREDKKEMISTRTDLHGRTRYYRHLVFHLHPGKYPSSFLEVIEDITDKREMEAAVVQADKLAAIGLLASGIAHEINNPLGILSIYSEDLKDRMEEEDVDQLVRSGEIHKYLETIDKQIFRCKTIITHLLKFSRKSSETYENTDVHQSMEEIVNLLRHEIRKKQVKMITNYEASYPMVLAGAGEIQQVLLNLITNALDAVSAADTIQVYTKETQQQQLMIEIADSGEGIAEGDLTRIFDPFFTTKPEGKGTGLGLSICYGIIKRLGGDIQIQSQLGLGTTVTVWLPLAKGGAQYVS